MTTSTTAHHSHIEQDSILEKNHQLFITNSQLVKDTIFVLDSIQLETRHDTVYHTRWRMEYRDRFIQQKDTLRQVDTVQIVIRDSIHVAVRDSIYEMSAVSPGYEDKIRGWRKAFWWLLIGNILIVGIRFVCYILRKRYHFLL